MDIFLIDSCCIISNEIDTRDLLEDLVYITKQDAVKIPRRTHGEEISVAKFRGFKNAFFDFDEFGLHHSITVGHVVEGGDDGEGFILLAFEDEPAEVSG